MMINEVTSCKNCTHKNVCSIKPQYEDLVRRVKLDYSSCPDHFSIDIRCKEFNSGSNIRTPQFN